MRNFESRSTGFEGSIWIIPGQMRPWENQGCIRMDYARTDAKDWAREHMRGVCNVIMPTFTSDIGGLNEAAIRHDVRRNIELGFWGALVVSECGTTKEEYKRFLEIVIDEAAGRMRTVVQGSFDTVDEVIKI